MCRDSDSSADASWPRSFIALAPDAVTRARLAQLPTLPRSKPIHIDDLHLTLAFIGAISEAQRRTLADALPALASAAGPIPPLAPMGIDAWPSPDRPRVRVAVYALPEALGQLVAQVQAVLSAAGLPVDPRPFRPHITLARFARGADAITAASDPPLEHAAHVDALGLFCRSDALDGPRYASLAAVPLG